MERNEFEGIKSRLGEFKHTSLQYTEFEDVQDYSVECASAQLIAITGRHEKTGMKELLWAADDMETLYAHMQHLGGPLIVGFIPEKWYPELISRGMKEYGVMREYWLTPLPEFEEDASCAPIDMSCAAEAAALTAECAGQSREFEGEDEAWMISWLNGAELNAADCGSDSFAVIGARVEGELAGVACVCVYSRESARGPILWLRELAVSPRFQKRGLGRKLVKAAVAHGRRCGATRSFLMADDMNANAVALYKSVGYEENPDEAQIDLIFGPEE